MMTRSGWDRRETAGTRGEEVQKQYGRSPASRPSKCRRSSQCEAMPHFAQHFEVVLGALFQPVPLHHFVPSKYFRRPFNSFSMRSRAISKRSGLVMKNSFG